MSISGLCQTVGGALLASVRLSCGSVRQEMFAVNSVEHRSTQTLELRRTVDASSAIDARV